VNGFTASLRRTAEIARHELLRVVKSPRLLLALYATPVVLTLVADLAFNWPGTLPGRLAVQDLDQSSLSTTMAGRMLKSHSVATFRLDPNAQPESYVEDHPDVVVVAFPAGLEASTLQGTAMNLKVVADRRGQRQAASALAQVRVAAQDLSAINTAVAAARDSAPKTPGAADKAAQVALKNALKLVPSERVHTDVSWLGTTPNSTYTRLAQWATGNGTMFMLFAAVALAALLAQDRREGQLRRLTWTRLRFSELMVGKSVAILLLSSVTIVLMIAESALFFGMSLGPSVPLLALIVSGVAVAACGYSILMLGVARVSPAIHGIGVTLTLGMSAIGGSWWPQETEAPLLRQIGHVTPNAWAADAFHSLLFFDRLDSSVYVPVLVLFGLGLVQALVGSWLFKRALRAG